MADATRLNAMPLARGASAPSLRPQPPAGMSEDELLSAVLDAARLLGWKRYHVRNSRLGVVQGDTGFPDLVLARAGTVRFVELKTETGKLRQDQDEWGSALPSREVLRPSGLDAFLETLR